MDTKVNISDLELTVAYKDIQNQIIELNLSSFDTSTFSISFPDFGDKDHTIKLEFESIEELENIIKDFKKKYDSIKIKENINKIKRKNRK